VSVLDLDTVGHDRQLVGFACLLGDPLPSYVPEKDHYQSLLAIRAGNWAEPALR
jgi:hypothetical protein